MILDHSPSQCLVLSAALHCQCPPLIAWQNIAWRHSTPSFRHFVYSPRVFLRTLNAGKNSRAGAAGDQLLLRCCCVGFAGLLYFASQHGSIKIALSGPADVGFAGVCCSGNRNLQCGGGGTSTLYSAVQYSTGPVRGAGPEPVVPRTPSSGHRGSVSGRPSGVAQ